MLIISAPHCDITSSCDDSNVANIHFLTYKLMETVEAKLEVNLLTLPFHKRQAIVL